MVLSITGGLGLFSISGKGVLSSHLQKASQSEILRSEAGFYIRGGAPALGGPG